MKKNYYKVFHMSKRIDGSVIQGVKLVWKVSQFPFYTCKTWHAFDVQLEISNWKLKIFVGNYVQCL